MTSLMTSLNGADDDESEGIAATQPRGAEEGRAQVAGVARLQLAVQHGCTGPMGHACTFSLFCNQIKSDHSQIIPSSVEKSWDTPTLG